MVRLIYPLLLIAGLAGCQRGGSNSTDAVRQAVVDRLTKGGFNMSAMDIRVAAVKFDGDQADATVTMTPKGQAGAPPMTIPYHLERQNGKWVASLAKTSTHGMTADPNAAATNPHGAAMPPAAAGADNPHGGMAPAAGSGMPSPHDLPPAKKK
jgi:hypothetical protein